MIVEEEGPMKEGTKDDQLKDQPKDQHGEME